MSQKTKQDLALDRLLDAASSPPQMSADLASRIAARARLMPQQRKSTRAPYAAGMALAASLALGIWMGAAGIGVQALGLTQTAALDDTSTADFTGLSEAEALIAGDTL